ncbi:MAG: hypothetical protein Q7T61_02270 [Caulobacter sp.]|nr:hypothetical protein [Caulobacter sp.]
MRKLFLIFCSSVVLTAAVAVVGVTHAKDDGLYATVSTPVSQPA